MMGGMDYTDWGNVLSERFPNYRSPIAILIGRWQSNGLHRVKP